ncbi:MAG: AMP-binding protein [Chlamydia sp.]
MRTFIYKCVYLLVRIVFSLRYRVRYIGLKEVCTAIKKEKSASKGILFLPNHPAVFTDPLLIATPLLAPFQIRPLITEYMYYNPFFYPVMKWIGSIPVPNFSVGVNPLKIDRLEKSIQKVERGLEKGENFLLYPAGTTKEGPREIVGGAFAAHDLVSKYPDTTIVLVRTTGLWGSRFSRAHSHGKQVEMGLVLKHAFQMLCKSLFFFLPRRSVTIEFSLAEVKKESLSSSQKRPFLPIGNGRKEFNRALEKWYNEPFETDEEEKKGEPLVLIPESCWSSSSSPTLTDSIGEKEIEQTIPRDIQASVIEKIAQIAGKPVDAIHLHENLIADVGLDSLNIAELISFIEVHYSCSGANPQELTTVSKACQYASGLLSFEGNNFDPKIDISAWEKSIQKRRLSIPEAENIIDCFCVSASLHGNRAIIADATAGILSYSKVKRAIFLLSREISKYEGENIGILLPASAMANILIIATQLAGKVPVMINWTVGGSHLEAVVEHAKLKTVLTSWSFLDRLENVDLRPIKEQIVVLEEERATFAWSNYFLLIFYGMMPWRWAKNCTSFFPHWGKITSDSTAVILFTSGTENMPKGVPLTHKNILTNLRSALHLIELYSTDRLLSMLPAFHSFGCAITGVMPLLAGLKAYYSPNPLDGPRLAASIRYWGISILCSPPTFLKNMLRYGSIEDPFTTVRMVVYGAEKPTKDLYSLAKIATPTAQLVEGYGITECSPILTANTVGIERGVGVPLDTVRLKIVDIEDYAKELSKGESGMILASGPNIFNGYLQQGISSPFVEQENIRWYITGDLGFLDTEGALHITGRLKRFIKIGGEMVSLGAVEESLERAFEDQIPEWSRARAVRLKEGGKNISSKLQNISVSSFAILPQGENEGKPRLILFSLFPITPVEANMALRAQGFSNLVKIDSIHVVDEFPLMGTGKIAYRVLENRL